MQVDGFGSGEVNHGLTTISRLPTISRPSTNLKTAIARLDRAIQ